MTTTYDEQLEAWLRGESLCPNANGECCPDFSCCRPELLAPVETRRAFVSGTEETRHHLLGGFLAEALSGRNVHIAGMVPEREDA